MMGVVSVTWAGRVSTVTRVSGFRGVGVSDDGEAILGLNDQNSLPTLRNL